MKYTAKGLEKDKHYNWVTLYLTCKLLHQSKCLYFK